MPSHLSKNAIMLGLCRHYYYIHVVGVVGGGIRVVCSVAATKQHNTIINHLRRSLTHILYFWLR